jgi:hypothetical protein
MEWRLTSPHAPGISARSGRNRRSPQSEMKLKQTAGKRKSEPDCPVCAGKQPPPPPVPVRWHVVGLQRSVREWAMRQGWGGRPVRVEQAQGILVAALGVLAGHYGYQRGGRVADAR